MKKILVTGAAGFIGSKTAEFLCKDGYDVVAVDNLNDYYDLRLKMHRLEHLKTYPNFKFYHTDIENLGALDLIFTDHKIDAIINLAARAGVRYSMINPHVYYSTNAQGTLNLLEMMNKHGLKKMVLASTSSLYAGLPMPFLETLPVNTPISPYAATKKAAEVMCHAYHALYDLDISVVRFFTVYGPGGRPDMSIFRFIKWIAEGSPVTIFGDGTQSRDFTYIDDIARGVIKALKPVGFEVINLGGGKRPVSINHIVSEIEKFFDKKGNIEYKPFHIADIKETWANIDKANDLLDWQPQIGIDEGLRKCLDWYVDNKKWLKDINCGEV